LEDGSAGADPLMRASTLNLIVLVSSPTEAARIAETIGQLAEFCPSRSVILVTDAPETQSDELTVQAAVHEHAAGRFGPPIRYETVTVMANSRRSASLANIASTLLVPELPDFLWWHVGDIRGHLLFSELVDIADRLIVDTSMGNQPGATLGLLTRLSSGPRPETRLSDLVWSRLTPWRQLVAQFFDSTDAQPCLVSIEEVEITYSGGVDNSASGLTSALLIAGWLASRLKWQPPGELVAARDGWRATLRSGEKGNRREVLLRIRSNPDNPRTGEVSSVRIVSGNGSAGQFVVERVSSEGLMTKSELEGMTPVSRMVFARHLSAGLLLSQELRQFGRDPIFEEALAFAAALMPEHVISSGQPESL
jgi:glucose-6-phosphate dehydrogenase assembly protein OpcA